MPLAKFQKSKLLYGEWSFDYQIVIWLVQLFNVLYQAPLKKPARAVKAFVFVCVLLIAVKCSWYQLPSVSREEAAFVEKGAFDELCVLIIDVRHSYKSNSYFCWQFHCRARCVDIWLEPLHRAVSDCPRHRFDSLCAPCSLFSAMIKLFWKWLIFLHHFTKYFWQPHTGSAELG